jgi:hypothetical protein
MSSNSLEEWPHARQPSPRAGFTPFVAISIWGRVRLEEAGIIHPLSPFFQSLSFYLPYAMTVFSSRSSQPDQIPGAVAASADASIDARIKPRQFRSCAECGCGRARTDETIGSINAAG